MNPEKVLPPIPCVMCGHERQSKECVRVHQHGTARIDQFMIDLRRKLNAIGLDMKVFFDEDRYAFQFVALDHKNNYRSYWLAHIVFANLTPFTFDRLVLDLSDRLQHDLVRKSSI